MTHAITMAFTKELVTGLLTEGHEFVEAKCIVGLPENADITGIWVGENDDLIVRFEHPDLPEVPDGEEPPRRNPVFKHPYPDIEGVGKVF